MRVLFFGTPAFAVPSLRRILGSRHDVVLVVTQPDRARGRGRRLSQSPVAEVALEAGIPVRKPLRVSAPEFGETLRGLGADLGVVVAYGQFLARRVREAPRLGYLVNAHASLLPRWRGAAPIAHAILAGDAVSGVSLMRVEREMDAGPVAAVRRTPIGDDESAEELGARLAELAAELVVEGLESIAAGVVSWQEQDDALATLAPKLEPSDAELDWKQPATLLARRVRAFSPRPGAWTHLQRERLRILAAGTDDTEADAEPGTVRSRTAGGLRIATGRGWLLPRLLQRSGGRSLDCEAFLRGHPIPDGSRLGNGAAS